MASNVDVTTATWGTTSLKKSTGEIYDQTAQNQIADNTGVCFYAPEHTCAQVATADDSTVTQYTFMSSGTYQAYTYGSKHIETSGTVSVTLDGTSLYANADAGATGAWAGGNAEVIITTTGWIAATFVHSDTGGGGSLKYYTITVRRKG